MGIKIIPPVGTKVRLTGIFLKNTGQHVGPAGLSTWLTVEDPRHKPGDSAIGVLIPVNEPHSCQEDPRGYEDIPVDERPKWRRINAANLEIVGAPPKAEDYP